MNIIPLSKLTYNIDLSQNEFDMLINSLSESVLQTTKRINHLNDELSCWTIGDGEIYLKITGSIERLEKQLKLQANNLVDMLINNFNYYNPYTTRELKTLNQLEINKPIIKILSQGVYYGI